MMAEKQILEVQNLTEMEKIHTEILDILFLEHDLTVPSAIGIIELIKADIVSGNAFDDDDSDLTYEDEK